MRTFIVGFPDQASAHLTGEHILFIFAISGAATMHLLDLSIPRTEQRHFGTHVDSFERQLGRDGMLECTAQVSRTIENSAIIDIGDIDIQDIAFWLDLRRFHRNSALASDATHRDLGHSP
jgi:hypothetical protein